MANMTLRLNDNEEKLLEEIMKHYGENTKSKALIRMINKHMNEVRYHREFSEQAAINRKLFQDAVRAIKNYDSAKQALNEYLI